MSRKRFLMIRRRPRPIRNFLRFAGLVAGAVLVSTAAAADNMSLPQHGTPRPPRAISSFDLNGRPMTLIAYGRHAVADDATQARIRESGNLNKAMPGYPVEPHVNVALKMTF